MLCMLPWLSYATGSSGDAESEFKITIISIILAIIITIWAVKTGRWGRRTWRQAPKSKEEGFEQEND
jgi:hypothetical protein